jgi:methionyl-tRNA formyltransferase
MSRRLAFLGSKNLGLEVLRFMTQVLDSGELVGVITLDDRSDARSRLADLQRTAVECRVPFRLVEKTSQFMRAIEEFAPDLVIVAGWYRIIPLDHFPSVKFYGLHASPLPKYRGNAPLVWKIINGETTLGISLFQLAAGIDDGLIVGIQHFPLAEDETIQDALDKATGAALDLLRFHLRPLVDGTAVHTEQNHLETTYCGLRLPEDGLIDWRSPAKAVHNFVRAQTHPYPGAFTRLKDGRVVKVWRTRVFEWPYLGVPGSVAEVREDSVIVACGQGAVEILAASLGDRPILSADPIPKDLRSLKVRLS